ncbi:hypothetical protein HPB48_003751 [Haemaphysalis longicornis]|uniref:Uncharacterized protein n=1 Tax=Haemaphysalis longicornis TaxID=44386 RepID=A0A9J6FHC2_HAELO|nr:hypothetical protein HPB48_003751 [Haemaphysalis longicornis]
MAAFTLRICFLLRKARFLNRYLEPSRKIKRGRPSGVLDPVRLKERHFPSYIPPSEVKAAPTRKCLICGRKEEKMGKVDKRNSLLVQELQQAALRYSLF